MTGLPVLGIVDPIPFNANSGARSPLRFGNLTGVDYFVFIFILNYFYYMPPLPCRDYFAFRSNGHIFFFSLFSLWVKCFQWFQKTQRKQRWYLLISNVFLSLDCLFYLLLLFFYKIRAQCGFEFWRCFLNFVSFPSSFCVFVIVGVAGEIKHNWMELEMNWRSSGGKWIPGIWKFLRVLVGGRQLVLGF